MGLADTTVRSVSLSTMGLPMSAASSLGKVTLGANGVFVETTDYGPFTLILTYSGGRQAKLLIPSV